MNLRKGIAKVAFYIVCYGDYQPLCVLVVE